MRQIANESDRVRQHNMPPFRQIKTSNRRIQRRKQLIFYVDASIGQRIKQSRLPGVRIADQRNCWNLRFHSVASIHRAPGVDCFKALVQLPNARTDQSSVRFQLCLTRTSKADATFLALKVSPAANQSGRQMMKLGEFYLEFALEAPRSLGENIENQAGTVQNATFELSFEISFLTGFQRRAGNDQLGIILLDQNSEFIQLALTNKISRIGAFS